MNDTMEELSSSDVDAWLADTSNPRTDVIAAVRVGDGVQRMMHFVDIDVVEAARDEALDIVDIWCATR